MKLNPFEVDPKVLEGYKDGLKGRFFIPAKYAENDLYSCAWLIGNRMAKAELARAEKAKQVPVYSETRYFIRCPSKGCEDIEASVDPHEKGEFECPSCKRSWGYNSYPSNSRQLI